MPSARPLAPPTEACGRPVTGLAFDRTGSLLASSSLDGAVRVLRQTGGGWQLRSTFGAGPGERGFHGVALHRDGGWVAAGLADGTTAIWPLAGGPRRRARGHLGVVNAVAGSGEVIATAGDDGTVRLLEAAAGQPRWWASYLSACPARLHTPRGWVPLASGPCSAEPIPAPALEAGTLAAHRHARTGSLCTLSGLGQLSLWSTNNSKPAHNVQLGPASQLIALPEGCAALQGGGLVLASARGVRRPVTSGAQALAPAGDGLLLAAGGSLHRLSADGAITRTWPLGGAPSALSMAGEAILAAGFPDGTVRVYEPGTRGLRHLRDLEETPRAAALRMAAAPGGTLAVGFADGSLGLWSPASGARLQLWRLHGAVTHLLARPGRLLAASELGQHLSLDMRLLTVRYSLVAEEIRGEIPVVWRDGRPCKAPAATTGGNN